MRTDQQAAVFDDVVIAVFGRAHGFSCAYSVGHVARDATNNCLRAVDAQRVIEFEYDLFAAGRLKLRTGLHAFGFQNVVEIIREIVGLGGQQKIADPIIFQVLFAGEAEKVQHVLIGAENAALRVVRHHIKPAVLDQIAVTLFALAQREFGLTAFGHVV